MVSRPSTLARTALHRCLVILGIVLMPLAVLASAAGVSVPIHRAIERVDDADESQGAD